MYEVFHYNFIIWVFPCLCVVCLNSCSVLFISLHRFDRGSFYPATPEGQSTMVGEGEGTGYNVNIPWNNVSVICKNKGLLFVECKLVLFNRAVISHT